MSEQHERSGVPEGEANPGTLLERLQRSARTLERLAEAPESPGEALAREASALRQTGAQLQRMLDGWTLLTDASHRLLNLPPDAMDTGIRDAVAVLGLLAGAQRCYVFLLGDDGLQMTETYAWGAPGVSSEELAKIPGMSLESFPWSLRQFLLGQTIVVPDRAHLPEEASAERGTCEALRIRSYANTPVFVGGQCIAGLVCDMVDAPRDWTSEEVRLLSMAGGMLAMALERKRRDAERYREKTLVQRARSVRLVSAALAHEVNNPLAFVFSNLAYLQEVLGTTGHLPPALTTECLEVLGEAQEGARRIQRIVAELKVCASHDDSDTGPVEPRAIIDGTLRMAGNLLRHRAEVVRAYPERLPPVLGTHARLGQVILNLLLNAAQAIPEGHASGHRITVSARAEADTVVLAISDTGRGIPPEVMPRIFEPFFTTRASGEGMGMGLAICRDIITSLGGHIRVASEPGRGTTVEVELPRAEREAPREAPRDAVSATSARCRVLLVDDEPRMLTLLARLLRGHDLVTASNGREALERLRGDTAFDLILCDLMMPELTGMDVYRAVRDTYPGLHERIVFVSGGAFTPEAERFLQQVGNPVVSKPFEIDSLRNLVAGARTRH